MFDPKDMNTVNENGTAFGGWSPALTIILFLIFMTFVLAGVFNA